MSVMSVMTLKFQHSMPFVISVAAQLESDTRGEQLRTNKMIKCTLLKYKRLGLRFPERKSFWSTPLPRNGSIYDPDGSREGGWNRGRRQLAIVDAFSLFRFQYLSEALM